MRTFTQRKLDLQLWRRIRTLAIIVVVGGVVVAGEYLPVVHHADAAAAK